MGGRVLITGSQGFIGRYLASDWLAADSEVLLLGVGRSPRSEHGFTHRVTWGTRSLTAPLPEALRRALAGDRHRYARLDLLDTPGLGRLLRDFRPTVIVHLAGALRDDPPDRLFRTNVEATISLIEALAGSDIPAPRLVLGSSSGVYGAPRRGGLPLREGEATRPLDLYSASKLAAEQVSRILCRRYRIPSIWARIFNVIGPGQEERHVCGRLAAQAAAIAGGALEPVIELGNLESTRDFINVRDVARALRCLAEGGAPGTVYNVASGRETSIRTVLEETLRLAGIAGRVELRRLPGRPEDVPRHYASVARLRRLPFSDGYLLARSLEDLLDYYGREVRSAAGRPPDGPARPDGPLEISVQRAEACPVVIQQGLLDDLPRRLRSLFPAAGMVVLTDRRVLGLYGEELVERMREAGIRTGLAVVPPGERSKSLARFRRLVEALHGLEFDRRSVLVNLGGGLVTDLGGFVAAAYLRGVRYVNVPTTLLAQHDAAVGGKVAVNTPWAKNFLGAFHQPRAVLADPCTLATLDEREIAAGVAEAVKVAVTGERALFELLEREQQAIRVARQPAVLDQVVRLAVARKVALVQPDPYEVDLRRALNLGHTFGHALETELAYSGIRHGEAVAFGLALATELARARGTCPGEDAERILRLLAAYGLPPPLPRPRLLAVCRRLKEIRLARGGKLLFVLPSSICSVEIVEEVEDEEVIAAIAGLARHPLLGHAVVDDPPGSGAAAADAGRPG